jgi:shikimate kinase
VLRDDNLDALRRVGVILYLKVSPPELARRLGSARRRPLLADRRDKAAEIARLLDEREHRYRLADITVCTDGLSPGRAAEKVVRALLGHARRQATP